MVTKDYPIVCWRRCWHILVVNTWVLEFCKITKELAAKTEGVDVDPESGEPLNEAARIVRATQTVEPEFDEHTGAPLNHAARVIISGPAAGTMAPIAEEPEFDQVTGAAMNEAARRLVGGRSDEPEFDELTGAPMNDAARRVMAQNS